MRLRLGNLVESLRGRRGRHLPPPVVGIGMVVIAALGVLGIGLLLAAFAALLA